MANNYINMFGMRGVWQDAKMIDHFVQEVKAVMVVRPMVMRGPVARVAMGMVLLSALISKPNKAS
jgi:hypothetical protein